MKELSIEEKVNRYDEAIKKAESLYKAAEPMSGCNVILETVFPELKESEEERIRKELISFLQLPHPQLVGERKQEKWIAWLEKQGEKSNPYSGISFEYNGHIWGMCARDNGVDILLDKQLFKHLEKQGDTSVFYVPEVSIKDAVEVTSRMEHIEDDMKPIADFIIDYAYWDLHKDEWNQPTLTVPLFRVLDALIQRGKPYGKCSQNIAKQDEQKPYGQRKECSDCQFNYAGECKGSCAMKRDEQKYDNVEPKFHEGDWVVYNHDICQIVKREEGCNKLVTVFGTEKELVNERNLSTARLWTIQDARPGDVLVASDESVFIYSGSTDTYAQSYVALSKFGGFDTKGGNWEDKNWVYPATKEQRDTLMKAMTDAGWEFDFEKKELKKIEQKPTWSEGDENVTDIILSQLRSDNFSGVLSKSLLETAESWLKSLKNRVQPKQEWSEEDGNRINRLIAYFEDKESFTAEDDVVYANWLKSLKNRIPTKTEWSEEDEKMMNSFLHKVEVCDLLTNKESVWIINRLKSLKGRILPKQEWSEEDKGIINRAASAIYNFSNVVETKEEEEELSELADRLQDLIKPQKQWSEEDEKMLNQIISIIEDADGDLILPENISIYTNWLKTLKPQNRWKPNKEQLYALREALAHIPDEYDVPSLTELFEQLKQL